MTSRPSIAAPRKGITPRVNDKRHEERTTTRIAAERDSGLAPGSMAFECGFSIFC